MKDSAKYAVIWGIAISIMIIMGFQISSLRVEKKNECDDSNSRHISMAIITSTLLAFGYAIVVTAIVPKH